MEHISNKNKVIFFLRHYNDIDHIVPVIYKWCTIESIPIEILITSDRTKLNDYRINFLRQFSNIRINYIDDLTVGIQDPKTGQSKAFPDTFYDSRIIKKLVDILLDNADGGLVIFDWVQDNMSQYINFCIFFISALLERTNKFLFVSLPHGDEPHFCKMIRDNELDYAITDIYSFGSVFDYVVVPNKSCAQRYYPHLDSDRIKILGSPRFNKEWLNVLSKISPKYFIERAKDKYKIIFFLRPVFYPIFWDEVVRTVKLLANFKEIYLIVKHHTRDFRHEELLDKYPELKKSPYSNVEIVFNDIESESLLQWADLVIDVGTSISFECVILKKPILSMEYLHATYTTISHYIKSTVMLCRDHLYNTVKDLLNNPDNSFYNERERDIFIKEMLYTEDTDVLGNYVEFLKSLLKGEQELTNPQQEAKNMAIDNFLKKEILKRDEVIYQKEKRIKEMENSISWKITTPLRSRFMNKFTQPLLKLVKK
jgi:hypothetical protein